MTRSTQKSWDKFERWVSRYRKVSLRAIEELLDSEYPDFDGGLFLCKNFELNLDLIFDFHVLKSELSSRVENKISFLRGYLVDISFDGPEFVERHSNFLTQQYPSKCNNAIGVWLEQDLEGNLEAGSYFGFQKFDVSFFCKNIKDVDLASMRSILPFDRMFVRLPKGQTWDATTDKAMLEQIEEDLKFDYSVTIHPKDIGHGDLFSMNFTWE